MTALAPAFRSIDYIAGLNLNYRKCRWVQDGTEERESLRTWISENCEEFREMQIVRHAKFVGTMIGPDGHRHRWSAPRKFIQRVLIMNASTKSLVERLCDLKIYAISVLSFIGSVCAPEPKTMPFSVQLQDRTTLYRLTFLELAPYVVLVLTWWVFTPSALRLAIELQHARPRLPKALRKSKRLVDTIAVLFSLCLPSGRKSSLHPPWPVAPRTLSILFVAWTMMANLMKLRRIKSRRLLLDYFWTNSMNKTLLGLFPVEPRESWDRSVVIVLLTSCST